MDGQRAVSPKTSPLRQRLEAALRDALRSRDPVACSALRSALAAIDNATAVPKIPPCPPPAARRSRLRREADVLRPLLSPPS